MSDKTERAQEVYAANRLAVEGTPRPGAIGVAELHAFLTDPTVELTPAQSGYLFRSPTLRETFQALKQRLSSHPLSMVAAASDGGVDTRHFDGGSLQIIPARRGDRVYLTVTIQAPGALMAGALLIVETAETVLKRKLPPPDQQGRMLVILDPAEPGDQALITALRDPSASGDVLALAPDQG